MIRLNSLHVRYGRTEALKGVRFDVHRGEILGVLGHNGAGKTTTLRTLCGLITPVSGGVEILDPSIADSPDRMEFKLRLGFCPDEPFQFPYLSGREMLSFMGSLYRMDPAAMNSRIDALLARLTLTTDANRMIHSYSRGMKRKLAIAGSILHEPDYWILDEPAESLDPVALHNFKRLAREVRDLNRAVVISTHQLSLAETLCDRLVILHQGATVFDGSIESLKRTVFAEVSSLEEIYFSLFGNMANSV
jgi:ABC-2 type transport system ATP-binding protein